MAKFRDLVTTNKDYAAAQKELNNQIINYRKLVDNYELQDSLYRERVSYLDNELKFRLYLPQFLDPIYKKCQYL